MAQSDSYNNVVPCCHEKLHITTTYKKKTITRCSLLVYHYVAAKSNVEGGEGVSKRSNDIYSSDRYRR